MRSPCFALVMTAVLGGCSGAADTFVRSFETSHPICPNGVVFFPSAAAVPSTYREVALFPIQGVLGREQAKLASAVHRQHAGELGANGIILTSSLSAATGNKVIGAAIGDPAQRRGMAVAIYLPADSGRVREACGQPGAAVAKAPGGTGPTTLVGPEELILASQTASLPRRLRALEPRRAGVRVRPFDLSGRVTRAIAGPPRAVEVPKPDGAAFLRNQDVRSALTNLERLHVVSGAEEVRPGLVRLTIRELAPRATLEYHIGYLHASYQAALPFGQAATVELWSQGMKLGEYSRNGLVVGADYARPQ
jgi:hypothetical protein